MARKPNLRDAVLGKAEEIGLEARESIAKAIQPTVSSSVNSILMVMAKEANRQGFGNALFNKHNERVRTLLTEILAEDAFAAAVEEAIRAMRNA